MKTFPMSSQEPYPVADADFDCPHCGRAQVVKPLVWDVRGLALGVSQCRSCTGFEIKAQLCGPGVGGAVQRNLGRIFPATAVRMPRQFKYCGNDILDAYEVACRLYPVHAGAAGAYVRRALELCLAAIGYKEKTLAQSIVAAQAEADNSRRLPADVLSRLEYIRELGNYALHALPGGGLVIDEITEAEVDVCFDALEDLVERVFEDPGRHYEKVVAFNEKLKGAGRKEMELPPPPPGYTLRPSGERNE